MDLKPIFLYPVGAGGQSCVFREPGRWIYPVTCKCLDRFGYVGLRWVMLGYADGTLNLSLIVRTWQHPPRRRLWRNKVTTRWEGPQSLPYHKQWLGKYGLLLIQTCTSKHVCMYVWPIYQNSHHHKSNCQKVSTAHPQICHLYVCMTHIPALTPL